MRKNQKIFSEVSCKNCKAPFFKDQKEISRRFKIGKTDFFCSRSCAALSNTNSCIKPWNELTPFRRLCNQAKYSASNRKIPFNLSPESLKNKWESQKGICPYMRVKMFLPNKRAEKVCLPNLASIDRIDSSRGYFLDNIEFVCYSINLAKSDFSKEQMQEFFKALPVNKLDGGV